MRRVLFALALLQAGPASAQAAQHNYVFLGEEHDQSIFVDSSTVQRAGNEATIWALWVFEPKKKDPSGKWYRYEQQHATYDCAQHTDTILSAMEYSDDGSVEGGYTAPFPVADAVVPDSFADIVLDAVCDPAFPAGYPSGDDLEQSVSTATMVMQAEHRLKKKKSDKQQ